MKRAGLRQDEAIRREASVTVIGAGGNIGSHLVSHVARMPAVRRLVVVDPGIYEAGNLSTQDIRPGDVGQPKASVQARKARRIRPALDLVILRARAEHAPLGVLRADVILACVDSRRSRQLINDMAWRLGVPWVDAGVRGDGLLARVNAYVPGHDNPCLECAWDQPDYDNLEQVYPCRTGAADPPPTGSPSSLGALAASLQAIEAQKLLAGDYAEALVGRQVVVDARHHRHYVTRLVRNPRCRRSEHGAWTIRPLRRSARDVRLRDLTGGRRGPGRAPEGATLRVDGQPFVRALRCPGCGWKRELLHLESSLQARHLRCRRCALARSAGRQGGPRAEVLPMVATGRDLVDGLDLSAPPASMLDRTLGDLGLRSGEIFTLAAAATRFGNEEHYEITGDGP